jgi:hypothetical protein
MGRPDKDSEMRSTLVFDGKKSQEQDTSKQKGFVHAIQAKNIDAVG